MSNKRQQVLDKLADFCLEQLENKNAPVAELELYLEHTRPDAQKRNATRDVWSTE